MARLTALMALTLALLVPAAVLAQPDDVAVTTREPRACSLLQLPTPPVGEGQAKSAWATPLWPSGLIPYEFDANVTAGNQTSMRQAMDALEAAAGMHFVPRAAEPNYLHIQNANGNSSYVGMIGGGQPINIYNWNYRFIMCHELMHALGEWHEQSRPDRANFITVAYANIQTGWSHNFDIQADTTTVGPFDFDSVMLYGACDASICCPANSTCGCTGAECWTMVALPQYAQYQGLMGNNNHLSTGDIDGLINKYGPCPGFTLQPVDGSITQGQTAVFTAAATGGGGGGTFSYQWRHNSGNITNGPRITGATTASLTITALIAADAGTYDCIATNACGSANSNPATLTVTPPCTSRADVAGFGNAPGSDGQITVDDLVYFLSRFFASDAAVADLVSSGGAAVPDGFVTVDDLVAFLSAFFAGCP